MRGHSGQGLKLLAITGDPFGAARQPREMIAMNPAPTPPLQAILFSVDPAQADMTAACRHLEYLRELSLSVRFQILLSPPLIGFIHITGDRIRYVAYIHDIVDYQVVTYLRCTTG